VYYSEKSEGLDQLLKIHTKMPSDLGSFLRDFQQILMDIFAGARLD
jgi:hypothetical protein